MTSPKQQSAARTPSALANAWEQRTLLVKEELAAARAASDAKTARLRALRLEKERLEAETTAQSLCPKATGERARRLAISS